MRRADRGRLDRHKRNENLEPREAVIYARVSSREQEEEGWSIDAQLRLLRDYALEHRIVVAAEFVEAHTAKATGRKAFGEMLAYLAENPGVDTLVEKTDRLYRNIRDWVTIEDLAVTLHFVREGQIIGPDSRSSDKLIHGFKVLMARNYVENLSEEIRKGMNEKALQGVYPSHAPLGYLNVVGSDGRRKIIVPDPERAHLVRRLFEEYERGVASIKMLARLGWEIGLRTKNGNRVNKACIHLMLTNPVYCGQIRWKDEVYPGVHEPLVSSQQFDRCQSIMTQRNGRKTGYGSIPFSYRGLIHCTCGQIMSGELKKGRYIYYHCQGPKSVCGRPYVREAAITAEFEKLFATLTPPPRMQAWLRQAVVLGHEANMEYQKAQEERLEAEIVSLRLRLERLYLDKVNGDLSGETYLRLKVKFETELREQQTLLASHQRAGERSDDKALETLELSLDLLSRFKSADSNERNKILRLLLSNCVWEAGNLRYKLQPPFDLMLKATQETPSTTPSLERQNSETEIWWR